MASGIILILSQICFAVGVFLVTFGVSKGFKDEGPYDWRAVINGSLIGGLFLIIVGVYWKYELTGEFF